MKKQKNRDGHYDCLCFINKKCFYFIDEVFSLRNEMPLTALIDLRFK